jgi:8-amino-7-oxononanoate synthase
MSDRWAPWARRLQQVREADRWRAPRTLVPTGATTARLDGHEVIVACSNDYLGLAHHPELTAAARGGGSTGSRLISGSRPVHEQLEQAVADWFGRPALLFNSGWHANLAVLSSVCEPGDLVASDAANHASIIDGLRLSKAERTIVAHGRPDEVPPGARLVVVEGLFSMDGDRPPLPDYPTEPWLCVDEAHSVGALGPDGRGVAALQGVQPDIVVGTFGKAFGAAGAFVVGPPALRDLLINVGRSFIFTTSLPEPVAAMALAGLRLATDERREQLAARTRSLRRGLAQLGWSAPGDDHIVPVVVGDRALSLAASLLERGVFAPAIRWPTVPKGQERIRLTVSAAHTEEQIHRILDALGPCP